MLIKTSLPGFERLLCFWLSLFRGAFISGRQLYIYANKDAAGEPRQLFCLLLRCTISHRMKVIQDSFVCHNR
jgi:hypothetical protein